MTFERVIRVQVSKTQARRALLGLRRRMRDNGLAGAINALEEQLNHRYGSFFPLNSSSRGNKDLADMIRQGTRGNQYRLLGQRLLEPGSLSEIDELDWSDQRPLVQIVLEITDMADTCYSLRVHNNRIGWGMISHGFSRLALVYADAAEGEAPMLSGQLEQAAADLCKQAEAALARPEETPELDLLRREFYRLADCSAGDEAFGSLLSAESGLLTESEAAALGLLMADPQRPRRCSWRAAAQAKLGILPNTACEDGWPPKPDLRLVAGIPRQRTTSPKAPRPKLAASA